MVINSKFKIPNARELFRSLKNARSEWKRKTPMQKWCYFYGIGRGAFGVLRMPLLNDIHQVHWFAYFLLAYMTAAVLLSVYSLIYYTRCGSEFSRTTNGPTINLHGIHYGRSESEKKSTISLFTQITQFNPNNGCARFHFSIIRLQSCGCHKTVSNCNLWSILVVDTSTMIAAKKRNTIASARITWTARWENSSLKWKRSQLLLAWLQLRRFTCIHLHGRNVHIL